MRTLSGADESDHLQPFREALIAAQAVPLRRDCEVHERRIVQIERPVQMFECRIELTGCTMKHRALHFDWPSRVRWNGFEHASGKRDGRWQIVAAHMAFVLDANQGAVLEGV